MMYLFLLILWATASGTLYVRARRCKHCRGTSQGCEKCVLGCGPGNIYKPCRSCDLVPGEVINAWGVRLEQTYLRAPRMTTVSAELKQCRASASTPTIQGRKTR